MLCQSPNFNFQVWQKCNFWGESCSDFLYVIQKWSQYLTSQIITNTETRDRNSENFEMNATEDDKETCVIFLLG